MARYRVRVLPVGLVLLLLTVASAPVASAENAGSSLPAIKEKVEGLESSTGLLTFFANPQEGTIWLEVPAPGEDRGRIGTYLYVEGLATGLGSNPVGIDRGQLGRTRLVELRAVGGKLLVEEQNTRYRALTSDEREARAVRESFATSIIWSGEFAAVDPDGSLLVDFTSFLLRDAHDVVARLRESKQGNYYLDADRSVVDFESCLAFPDNLEFEALLTYASDEPGPLVTSPTPQAITLAQHHSLVRLPDDSYRPRRFDPRAGTFGVGFLDYASPLDGNLEVRWAERHRLFKTDPMAERSRVTEPIVYYVDPGIPEPIRDAVLEGAGWWARAFEEAGFIDAFRVEVLPADKHPLDVRNNVIQWVHRSTRGWSYGGGVTDPRTGEIIKGHVSLGSLRVRQDRVIFEGLSGTDATGSGGPGDPVELSLARIRQLAAHEVGHSLGLSHNFAASTYGGRASVMDYPAPLIGITESGSLDFSNAYGAGVGQWDVQAIRYLYSQYPPGPSEQGELEKLIQSGIRKGYLYLSDEDARPSGASDPRANLWDNGSDAVEELVHALRVRRIALDNFGERNIARGTPLGHLEEVLGPVYFYHRYQLTAAAKTIGGMEYGYSLRGDGQPGVHIVDAGRQRRAIDVVVGILSPQVLDLPDSVLVLLLPPAPGESPSPELFATQTAPAFDALGAAATASRMVLDELLQPERSARMIDFHRRDPDLPGFEELLRTTSGQAFSPSKNQSQREAEIQRVIQQVVVGGMIELAEDESAPVTVRSRVDFHLEELIEKLQRQRGDSDEDKAIRALMMRDIAGHLERGRDARGILPGPAEPPPGSPIGLVPGIGFGECSHSDWPH